jgi:hypothetical protein
MWPSHRIKKVSTYKLTLCSTNKIKEIFDVWTNCGRPTRSRSFYVWTKCGRPKGSSLNVRTKCGRPTRSRSFYVWTKCVRPKGSWKVPMCEVILCSANKTKKSFDVWTNCVEPRKVSKHELNVSSQGKFRPSNCFQPAGPIKMSTYWATPCVIQMSVTDWVVILSHPFVIRGGIISNQQIVVKIKTVGRWKITIFTIGREEPIRRNVFMCSILNHVIVRIYLNIRPAWPLKLRFAYH